MSFFSNTRHASFWFFDFCKGGAVRKHYKEIKSTYHNFHSDKSKKIQKSNLEKLLSHATSTTPFYKKFSGFSSLDDFPITNKLIVREKFNDFKSENFLSEKQIKVSSSGSTGTPFNIYQNIDKRNRNIADTIFFAELTGYKLGETLFFIRVWTKKNKKSKLLSWLQNIRMVDTSKLDDKWITDLLQRFGNDNSKKAILSYASTLEEICKHLDRKNSKPIHCNLSSVIANSERLNGYTSETFEKYFNTPVFSRYSNAECGILSQQNLNSKNIFEINWASYFIEILKLDSDEPANIGDIGRVVVTDLFNYCMPLIRYDTGDIASFGYDKRGILGFELVEGRKQDSVYNTKGELISSFIFGGLMKKYSHINQFQFIQQSKTEYLFKLSVDKKFNEEEVLLNEFKEILGDSCDLNIEYVKSIPVLESGKRRQVINHCI